MGKYTKEQQQEALKKAGFATRAIHAGQLPDPTTGAVMTPIFQTSTYLQTAPGEHTGYDYSRTANPTRSALEQNLAALEGAKYGFCFSSGCGAADTLLHMLSTGDHVLSIDDVYGGTYRLFKTVFEPLGVTFTLTDLTDVSNFDRHVTPKTKMLWLETPTNPLLRVCDIKALVAKAHAKGILVVVDNTFASPYLQQPLELGADVVLHSSTKYLGGHTDVIGGALLLNDDALAARIKHLQNAVGAVPAPLDCFLLLRSTKTLSLRMERHSKNAQEVAAFLKGRSEVEGVLYPWLPDHPQYNLAKTQMKSGGGMVTMTVKGGIEGCTRFVQALKMFSLAESLGGVESLVNHPARMTHGSIPKADREARGITDGLVRLSIGIEDIDDIIADLRQALEACAR